MNLVNVINKTLSRTDDQILIKDLTEFLVLINESVEKLRKSSKMLEGGQNKEGVEFLISGANGVINNVIHILNSHDDSQIRKIEKLLLKIKNELEKIVTWDYVNLVQIAESMQNDLVGAVRLLNSRIPEIIDGKLGERILLANNDFKEQMEKFIIGLNKVFETAGKSENLLFADKSSMQKFQLHKTVITLLSLIWMETLENDDIEIFYKSLPDFTTGLITWLTAQASEPYQDIFGKYIIEYILNSIDNFLTYKNFPQKNIPLNSLKTRRSLVELTDLLSKNSKISRQLFEDLSHQLESIKIEFMESYMEYIKINASSTKLAHIMCADISSNTDFNEWRENIKSICESGHNLCEISSTVKPSDEMIEIISDLLKYTNLDNPQDFTAKNTKYQEINRKTTKLQGMINQLFADKNLYSTLQVIEAGEEFMSRIIECPSEGKDCQDSLIKAEMNLSILEKNIDSLQKITLHTINSHPMPMSSIYQIEKSLEKMYFNRNLLRQMVGQLKKAPENQDLKQSIIDLTDETMNEARKIERIIIQHTDMENLIKYSKSCCMLDSNLNAAISGADVPLSVAQISQFKNIFEEIQVKILKENETCTDPRVQEIHDNNLQAIQQAYKDVLNGINPSLHLSRVKSMATLQEIPIQPLEENIEKIKLEDKKEEISEISAISPLPAQTYVIPEKYIKANEVIQKHDENDRLAVAASELHKQVKLENIQDSSISKCALDISYMFADFSTLFRENVNHSEMISVAKNISSDTLNIVKLAKELMSRCRDARLKQVIFVKNRFYHLLLINYRQFAIN